VSTLAHVFEQAGLATIALGSIRKQIAEAAPPRGLWCDFPLGRPLGKPGDAAFQTRVLEHAFSLLDATEQVLEEFAERISDEDNEALSCPMPPRTNKALHPALDEVRGLRPAYDRGIALYGNRAATGRVISADEIEEALATLVRVSEGTPWTEAGIPGIPARVVQDIRGYYEVAALGLSDHIPSAWAGASWFFDETQGGKVVLNARAAMRDAGEERQNWYYMAPVDR